MLLSILYALFALLADLALVRCRRGRALDVELLALRHEVRVLRRRVRRTAWRPGDRFVLTLLSRRRPRAAWGALPVRPETLLRWHRELVGRTWAAFGGRRGPGRPPLPDDVRDPIRRLADDNPAWGYQRIRGELLKLGIAVSNRSVRDEGADRFARAVVDDVLAAAAAIASRPRPSELGQQPAPVPCRTRGT